MIWSWTGHTLQQVQGLWKELQEQFHILLDSFKIRPWVTDESPGNNQPNPVRAFRAYIEKYWETASTKKNDQQSEAKLLKKYGGLQFKGDNYGIIYTINSIYI